MNEGKQDAMAADIDRVMNDSWDAFQQFRNTSLQQRAGLLNEIAELLSVHQYVLVETAHRETALDTERLHTELKRTCFQLNSYAKACAEGTWLDVRIDTPNNPQQNDLRKMLVPLGPVIVFGASNFPFAYSTAGGDTACALAAGCTVVVKCHPAHAATSVLVARIIDEAVSNCGLPKNVFQHVFGASFEVGKALVQHRHIAAVGFTGSLQGGRALFDLANQRPKPIPVFAEMGSVNPVFMLPQKLQQDSAQIAEMYAASITNSAGQFCTAPGVLVVQKNATLENFALELAQKLGNVKGAQMLHQGIVQAFHQGRQTALQTSDVVLLTPVAEYNEALSLPTFTRTTAQSFIQNKALQHEVFGPYCIMVVCDGLDEMQQVAETLDGQLTASLMATESEAAEHPLLLQTLQNICGRFIFNGIPTGVQVALAMQHGGPYPATTDSRFTAVGGDGIKRFARPVCFQNWSNSLLPDALKNENRLQIWRTVNNNLTKDAIV